MVTAFRDKYIDLLRTYYFVGGMPAAVNAYLPKQSLTAVRRVQQRLISDYEQDFSKHAPTAVIPRIRMVWDGIPSQLAKENKKFIYSVLREGARAKDFELAIQWLIDCGLCCKVGRVTKGAVPLKAYQDVPAFKLYLVDVGLLAAMTDLDAKTLLKGQCHLHGVQRCAYGAVCRPATHFRSECHALLLVGGKFLRGGRLRSPAQRECDPAGG